MTLVLSVVVLVSDDSGERDVRETLPALVRASMPAPDARRRIRQQRLYCMQRAGLPAIAETFLSDGVNERMLRCADCSAKERNRGSGAEEYGGDDGTRTRGLCRDRAAF